MGKKWSKKWIVIGILVFFLAGCGYHLLSKIPSWPEGIQRVYVEIMENQTMEPGLERSVTEAFIEELWSWGNIKVVKKSEAQAILSGIITRYSANQPISIDSTGKILEYELLLGIKMQLIKEDTKDILWQKEGTAKEIFQYFEDISLLRSEENKALRKTAKDLARKIVLKK